MTTLYDNNFDEELNCNEKHGIVIGYKDTCDTCKRLTCVMQMKRIKYAKIDMNQNKLFLENLKKKIGTRILVTAILYTKMAI